MKNLSKIIISAAVVLMVCGVSNAMGQFLFFGNPLVGKPAPNFTLKTLSGEEVNFQTFRSGKPAIIFFWATWCPHCREQLDELAAKKEKLESQGIKIALVDIEESPGTLRAHFERHGNSFEVFLDEISEVSQDYFIVGVPSYVFLNQEGIVRAVKHELPENVTDILQ